LSDGCGLAQNQNLPFLMGRYYHLGIF
jgi:hypothetical protein